MPAIDLSALTLEELKALEKDVPKAIKDLKARQKAEALAAVEAKANEFGFSLSELGTTGTRKTVSAPKYQHPENPELTWTGKGRKPAWFAEALAAGVSANDMLIG